jgi:hypothetical protein
MCPTQIGDLTEIMYFVAHSQDEMEEWLRAFRHGKNHNTMIKDSTCRINNKRIIIL